MHPDLVALLTDTVQHAAYQGQDGYGAPTYGTPVARPVRVEYATQTLVVGVTGDLVNQAYLYFNWDFSLDERDQLTLETGESPRISKIERWKDEHGQQDYLRVHL